MIPRPQKATLRTSPSAISATSGGLDAQPVSGAERARRLRRQLVPVQQVPTRRARLAALGAGRGVAAALRDQREAHLVERLELAGDAVAAAVAAGAPRAVAARVRNRPQRELELERLDRGVERVG